MIFVESLHGPGVVGFVGNELARYHSFTACFSVLQVPLGSKAYSGVGYDVSYNRNAVIKFALEHKDVEWVQLWDDDHVFAPDVLMQLLDHNRDVVVPFYSQRQPPFRPCIFKSEDESGGYHIFSWTDIEGVTGLFPVISAGAGGLLVRRPVLEAIGSDWFERQGKIGEDHVFYKKCIQAGFQPHVALDVPLGHSTPVEVWPTQDAKGRWGVRVDLKGDPPLHVEYWSTQYQEAKSSNS